MKTTRPRRLKYITDLAATISATYEAIGHGQQPSAMRTAGYRAVVVQAVVVRARVPAWGRKVRSHMPTYVPSGLAYDACA
jgi:hypothetical protein